MRFPIILTIFLAVVACVTEKNMTPNTTGLSCSPTRSVANGMVIIWDSGDPNRNAQVSDVASALLKQLEYIQTTPQGSDQIARAIFKQLEVVELLTGSNEVSMEVPE